MSAAGVTRNLIPGEALQLGDQVRTPTGRTAVVIEAQDARGEAGIEWQDGQRARFRRVHLRREDGA